MENSTLNKQANQLWRNYRALDDEQFWQAYQTLIQTSRSQLRTSVRIVTTTASPANPTNTITSAHKSAFKFPTVTSWIGLFVFLLLFIVVFYNHQKNKNNLPTTSRKYHADVRFQPFFKRVDYTFPVKLMDDTARLNKKMSQLGPDTATTNNEIRVLLSDSLLLRNRQLKTCHILHEKRLKAIEKFNNDRKALLDSFFVGKMGEMYQQKIKEMAKRVGGGIDWTARPNDLNHKEEQVYNLFLPGDTAIYYYEEKDHQIILHRLIKHGQQYHTIDEYGILKPFRPDNLYRARLKKVYTKNDYPLIISKLGSVSYKAGDKEFYLPKARRKYIRTKLQIDKVAFER